MTGHSTVRSRSGPAIAIPITFDGRPAATAGIAMPVTAVPASSAAPLPRAVARRVAFIGRASGPRVRIILEAVQIHP
jgi:hypothetical protein